jgi:NDP-sugar pyrophosphorylase family protein
VLDGNRVARYAKGLDPAPPEMRWIDYGLSVLTRQLVADRVPQEEVADLAPLCSRLAEEGLLAAFLATERFYEIGSPDGLREAEEQLLGQ